jgi:hypothetical protein
MAIKDTTISDLLATIGDRRKNPVPLVEQLVEHWSFDLYSRNPAPALAEAGVLKPTDLDLSTFLIALAARKAVINLPVYKARRGGSKREGEHIISKTNRHGNLLGLRSNQDVFSFGVLVKDMNVMTTDENDNQEVGAFRNFMILDVDGTWHAGWRQIDFVPTAKENNWLHDKDLWTGNQIVFSNFVHPNRWTSFFGKYYLASKAMIDRLSEETSALRRWIKDNRDPKDAKVWPKAASTGETKTITVQAFQTEVDMPALHGKFRLPTSVSGAEEKLQSFTKLMTDLRFATRATELAFYQNGRDRLPSWMGGAEWEEGVRTKGGRKLWSRIEIPNTKDVALRYRVWDKSETVAAE